MKDHKTFNLAFWNIKFFLDLFILLYKRDRNKLHNLKSLRKYLKYNSLNL